MKKVLCISMIAACCGLILEDADASRRMAQATAAGESAVASMRAARRGRVAPVVAPVQQQQQQQQQQQPQPQPQPHQEQGNALAVLGNERDTALTTFGDMTQARINELAEEAQHAQEAVDQAAQADQPNEGLIAHLQRAVRVTRAQEHLVIAGNAVLTALQATEVDEGNVAALRLLLRIANAITPLNTSLVDAVQAQETAAPEAPAAEREAARAARTAEQTLTGLPQVPAEGDDDPLAQVRDTLDRVMGQVRDIMGILPQPQDEEDVGGE